uniref:Uncharacterized protein n=1 Tax=Spongospora subterranea TaxID=70186 RepID=A0A0H5RBZ1_9EUKA|eukprot:CRZ11755.1 hypothetical protein [Spongospora subterranea]
MVGMDEHLHMVVEAIFGNRTRLPPSPSHYRSTMNVQRLIWLTIAGVLVGQQYSYGASPLDSIISFVPIGTSPKQTDAVQTPVKSSDDEDEEPEMGADPDISSPGASPAPIPTTPMVASAPTSPAIGSPPSPTVSPPKQNSEISPPPTTAAPTSQPAPPLPKATQEGETASKPGYPSKAPLTPFPGIGDKPGGDLAQRPKIKMPPIEIGEAMEFPNGTSPMLNIQDVIKSMNPSFPKDSQTSNEKETQTLTNSKGVPVRVTRLKNNDDKPSVKTEILHPAEQMTPNTIADNEPNGFDSETE